MPVTVDVNRVMFPTQRRFNAAWREMSGDRVRLLPQVAREIMHHRLDPEFMEEEVERARTGLARVRNSATEREIPQVQDEMMPRMYAGPEGRRELCAIGLGAAWPSAPDAQLAEVERALQGMLGAMEGARLGDTGAVIADTWRSVADPETLLEEVRTRLPERMRASERRHPAFARAAERRHL